MAKKKSNAEALADSIWKVLKNEEPDEESNNTLIAMIEEVIEVETKKAKGKGGGNKDAVRKECIDAICPLCKKGVEIIQWSKHLIKKNGVGPGVHETAQCKAVNIRLLERNEKG
jgi:hypothetical protein